MSRQAPVHPATAPKRTIAAHFAPFVRRPRRSNRAGGTMKPGAPVLILSLLCGLAVFQPDGRAARS